MKPGVLFRALYLIIFIAALAAGCASPAQIAPFVAENAFIIHSTDDWQDFSDLEFLLPHACRSRIVMYGESPHGTRDHLELMFRMLIYLNREAGYRYFAPETDFAYGELLNRYLECGDPALLDEMDIWHYYCAAHTNDHRRLWQNLYRYNMTLPHDRRIMVIPVDISHGLGYALKRLRQIPATLPEGRLREEVRTILQPLQGSPIKDCLQAVQALEDRLRRGKDEFQPVLLDYEYTLFLVYSTRRSLELAMMQGDKNSDWNAGREMMMRDYFRWHVEHSGESPDRMKIFTWHGAAHVSKSKNPKGISLQGAEMPIAAWLDSGYDWSRAKVFSIYSVATGGQYVYGAKDGMKLAPVSPTPLDAYVNKMLEEQRLFGLFTKEPGKNGQTNPFKSVEQNGVPYGLRYDLLVLIRNARPADPLP